ncbi:hypothetical protein [Azotobacter vinelandii]|uniref:hypothetical protein n=1 Tax=Azotobacter vinelandii TaxID=354 RepID=UPI0026651884|nr:hypothetical protein [Azotobacter vinelandii]WKN20634.1 hypothetical protein AVAEIV_003638 [Azotobacter vinelandii]
MIRSDWNALLPNHEAIVAMTPEKLDAAGQAAECYAVNIGFGIAAIGNLLAGAASSSQGLDPAAIHDLGWLLESLGKLSAKLVDTGSGIDYRRNTLKRED